MLKESCHLPRDALCSTLQHVIGHFRPDLRGLVHENVFAFKRILTYLRLNSELPGVEDHVDVLPPPYVRSMQVSLLSPTSARCRCFSYLPHPLDAGVSPTRVSLLSFASEIQIGGSG